MPHYADTSSCSPEEIALWERLRQCENLPFHTSKGLEFSIRIRGNELFVDRKEKSITRSSVNRAFRQARDLGGVVPGPKTLGTFGASYLYPIFCTLGIIDPEKSRAAASGRQNHSGL